MTSRRSNKLSTHSKLFIKHNQSPHEPSLGYHISVDEELRQVLITTFSLLGNQWEESVHYKMRKPFFFWSWLSIIIDQLVDTILKVWMMSRLHEWNNVTSSHSLFHSYMSDRLRNQNKCKRGHSRTSKRKNRRKVSLRFPLWSTLCQRRTCKDHTSSTLNLLANQLET